MILWELFITFMQISLLAVGGEYVAIPLMESTIVEQRAWLTMPAFADLVTIAEMTPGPIALNAATFVGFRVAGVPGALIATTAVGAVAGSANRSFAAARPTSAASTSPNRSASRSVQCGMSATERPAASMASQYPR